MLRIVRSSVICNVHQTLYGSTNRGGKGVQDVWRVSSRREIHTMYWWRNLRCRDHLEDVGIDGKIILKWILNK